MSYWIYLRNKNEKNPVEVKKHREGGTYAG
jgi:hypothetical protein